MQDAEIAKEGAILVNNADRFSVERWIEELEAWEPETAIYYYCLAMINERKGEKDKAVENYEKALSLDVFRARPQPETDQLIRKYTASDENVNIDVYSQMKKAASGGLKINRFFRDGLALNASGETFFRQILETALIHYYMNSE
ncbi:MAG: tetratricopeptide repeat protein [Candidatus Marinimicrobia bacterium]|nr:tetratricopeptide repeat protein [Candidatus Neomarinimicrobiota bacterium]